MPDVISACMAYLLLPYWALLVVVVAARDCDLGSLQCASVMGNDVEFCHWDRPRLFKQPEIVCNGCRRAQHGDVIGVACNAIALRHWADSEPIWLQAPLFASRDVGLIGHVHYELRRDMFGKVTIVGTMEGADVTYQRLKRKDDGMFRSLEVSECFEATITSMTKDGQPIHYTLTGPSKIVELKEPNLWIGSQGFARLTLRPIQCRLNRGIKEETPRPTSRPPPPPPAQQGPPPVREADHHVPPPDLQPTGSNLIATAPVHGDVIDPHQHRHSSEDESVELVFPDGHVEIVPERYVQQHFVTPDAGHTAVDPYADHHHHHDAHAEPRVVSVNPVPVYGGQLPPVQYHAVAADHHHMEHQAQVIVDPATADHHIVMPMPTGGNHVGGSPVAVVPVVYYVTDPHHAVPASSSAYVTAAF